MYGGLLGCEDFDKTVREGIEIIGPRDMEVETRRVELGEDVDFLETGVDAIGNRDIDDAELAPERNGWFGSFLGEWIKAGTFSSAQYD